MKKGWILFGVSVLSLGLLTGCTSSADMLPTTSPSPSARPSSSPQATMNPSASPSTSMAPSMTEEPGMGTAAGAGISTVEDARRVSDRVSEEVEKLSELTEAEAIVAGNIALVGVKYDSQYQGGMTDRLKQMVEERVDMVDKSVTTVHVTDDGEMLARIAELREKLEDSNMTFEQLQTRLLDIGSGIAGEGMPGITQPQATTGA